MVSKAEFLKGFEKKSFLGSQYPQLRTGAPKIDKAFATKLGKQFTKMGKANLKR